MFKPSKSLEILFAACLYYSGLLMFTRWWTQRLEPKVLILCYHRSNAKNLRRQMMYLKRAYRVLHLDSALEELCKLQEGHVQTSDRRTILVLTFDDGYEDNYTHSFALARELQIPITVFLVSDYLENRRPFAWLAGEDNHLVPYARVKKATIKGRTYFLDKLDDCNALKKEIDNSVRFATSIAERDNFLALIREALEIPSSLTDTEMLDMPLTWNKVREMEASGWASFGAHTVHHPILACLIDSVEVRFEVSESRKLIEARLGHPVHAFAYPYGKPEQIGEIGPQAVQEARYEWALTTVHGSNTSQTDRHLLHRIVVDVDDHWLVLAAKASGVWDFVLKPLRKPMGIIAHILRLSVPYSPYN